MTGKEYLNSLSGVQVDREKTDKIASLFTGDLPDIVLRMISNAKEPVFLDDGSRVLSFNEIADAETDLHVAFRDQGMIPLVDRGENNFIVYHFLDKIWSKFNIVDETVFGKKDSLAELLK